MPDSRRNQLTCPKCGTPMNHHAEKLVVTADSEPGADADLGGYIQELHGCPKCGHLESRR
jgi:ribosomal protein S27AE